MNPLLLNLLISAIASAGGTAIQFGAQRDAQRRQMREIDAARAEQEAFDRRRQAQVLENAVNLTQDPAVQLQQVVAPAQERLEGVARQAAQVTTDSQSRPVGASSRYDTEMAKRAASELERAIVEAGMAARAGGGRQMMFEQGLAGAQGASDVDNIVSLMQQAARNSQTRIQQAGNVSPGRMLAGGLLAATGQAIGAGAGAMAGAPAAAAAGGSGVSAGASGATGLKVGAGAGLKVPPNTLGWNPMYGLRG